MLYCFFDLSINYQIGFQDAATPFMEALISLYNRINICLIVIFSIVCWFILRTLYIYGYTFLLIDNLIFIPNFLSKKLIIKYLNKCSKTIRNNHNYLLEIIWTITPSILLIIIAIPSFILLYIMDELILAKLTIKIIGHQWYWSYEYSDYIIQLLENALTIHLNSSNIELESRKNVIGYIPTEDNNNFLESINIEFDSYMIPEDELISGQLRLLEVDNPLVIPIRTHVRLLVTSSDVLHSWCIPSLGIKMDAVPGRLNQTSFFIKRVGTFYGQCSEICGVNHGFMPIVVESVTMKNYLLWLNSKIFQN